MQVPVIHRDSSPTRKRASWPTSEGSPTSNLPLRGGKGWLYEGGIREPFIVRWPGVTKAGSTSAHPVMSTDFFTTFVKAAGGKPDGDLAGAIDSAYASFEGFQEAFAKAAATRYGSGWAWLCCSSDVTLCVCSTPNQDNPLMDGCCTPILGLDVWEHAYYLNYQNRRPDYIEAFWSVVNWNEVSRRFDEARNMATA